MMTSIRYICSEHSHKRPALFFRQRVSLLQPASIVERLLAKRLFFLETSKWRCSTAPIPFAVLITSTYGYITDGDRRFRTESLRHIAASHSCQPRSILTQQLLAIEENPVSTLSWRWNGNHRDTGSIGCFAIRFHLFNWGVVTITMLRWCRCELCTFKTTNVESDSRCRQ